MLNSEQYTEHGLQCASLATLYSAMVRKYIFLAMHSVIRDLNSMHVDVFLL